MKKYIWAFMIGVAIIDIVFTWQCRSTVAEWEANPVACWAFESHGVLGAAIYRAAWLVYAAMMSWTRTRFSWLVTPIWGIGHCYLLVTLVQAYQYLPILQK
jgi:hypothetical protein